MLDPRVLKLLMSPIKNPNQKSNGQYLKYNGTTKQWEAANGGAGGASDISDLDDVDIDETTLADGQLLIYDATAGKWKNVDAPTGAYEIDCEDYFTDAIYWLETQYSQAFYMAVSDAYASGKAIALKNVKIEDDSTTQTVLAEVPYIYVRAEYDDGSISGHEGYRIYGISTDSTNYVVTVTGSDENYAVLAELLNILQSARTIISFNSNFSLDAGGTVAGFYSAMERPSTIPVFRNLKLENSSTPIPWIIPYVTVTNNTGSPATHTGTFAFEHDGKTYHGSWEGNTVQLEYIEPIMDSVLPSNGDVLRYNSAVGKYQNSALGTAAVRNATDNVIPGSQDLVSSGTVHSAINQALTSVYTPRGDIASADLTSALLIAENVGSIYETSDGGTTTADFLQGAGINYSAGQNVGIIQTGPSTYKFNLMSNSFDLHDYAKKSDFTTQEQIVTLTSTNGNMRFLLKKSGKVVTCQNVDMMPAGTYAQYDVIVSGSIPTGYLPSASASVIAPVTHYTDPTYVNLKADHTTQLLTLSTVDRGFTKAGDAYYCYIQLTWITD